MNEKKKRVIKRTVKIFDSTKKPDCSCLYTISGQISI